MVKNSVMLMSHRRMGTLFCLRKKGGRFMSNWDMYPVVATKINCTNVSSVPALNEHMINIT
jgi:hypothetical protein